MAWVEAFVASRHAALDDRAREALAERGVDDDQIDLFRLGVTGLEPLLVGNPAFDRWAQQFGDRLQDAFVLPLTNALGEVKGLQFRGVEKARKGYIDFFLDDTEPVFFGLGQAMPSIWATRSVWLVEGGFDLFPLQRLRPNTVSALTAKASPALARLLRRLVDRVYLAFDDDVPGRRGSQDFRRDHGQILAVCDLPYPLGVTRADGLLVKDPSDLWEAWGDDRLEGLLRCTESEEPSNYAPNLSPGRERRRSR
jgi:DNA primase